MENIVDIIKRFEKEKLDGVWINGDIDNGEFKSFYANGNVKLHYFHKNNEYDGKFVAYYPNGNKEMVKYYKDGVWTGRTIIFNDDGEVIYEGGSD